MIAVFVLFFLFFLGGAEFPIPISFKNSPALRSALSLISAAVFTTSRGDLHISIVICPLRIASY